MAESRGRLGVLEADETNEEEVLGRVKSVIADEDGAVFVADGIALDVRVFSPTGGFMRRLGGEGAGPGEIAGLHGIDWLASDTLLVVDYGNARLTRMSASTGEHFGHWNWIRLTGSARFVFNGGLREAFVHGFRVPEGGERRSESIWVQYTPGEAGDTLLIPNSERRPGSGALCQGDGIGFFENPFGDRIVSVPVVGSRRALAWASEYRVVLVDSQGDTARVLTREVPTVPVPDSAWAPVQEGYTEFVSAWRGADCSGDVERPAHLPPVRGFFSSHEGHLMVEYVTPDGVGVDTVDDEGNWLSTLVLPEDCDQSVPLFVRGDRLYLVTKTELDVQQVQVYRVVPPAEG